ncbi:TetR/AcrR family transcriptional regulator [Blastococcus sp. URHD0036]|uniref:TetR/AcrR family transcriptional regulator n=1 Tax=Blastococcus sp. URHD0036 TaxID=1380356 RepID=UPI000497B470|nr:TetR/AcrR family transcriptional regulator [Blastococcus sp. URHD0036]
MSSGRPVPVDEGSPAALLDAAEKILIEEGYAAASSRRVAGEAGLNAALVYYYFGTMDDLFVALFRRGSDRSFQRLQEALSADQPLWSLWEAINDRSSTALTLEFIALANHRKAIRSEISSSALRFRRMELDAVTEVLARHPQQPPPVSPAALILLMGSVSRFLLMEKAFDVTVGHEDAVAMVEGYLTAIEGDRRPTAA